MQLSNNDACSTCKHRVIIGGEGKSVNDLSDSDQNLLNDFLKLDKESSSINSLDSSTLFVKANDNKEKMRKAGAAYRMSLDKDITEVGVNGESTEVYSFIEGFELASYQFIKYFKDADEKAYKLKDIYVGSNFSSDAIEEITHSTQAVFWARDMVNEPVSFLNAEQLAEEVRELGNSSELEVTILEKSQIEALKMGGILAVNKGSIDPPAFIIAEYKGKNATNKKPIVLVGKGVVYDTGGLSLKPTPNSMDIMKSDMGGAACMAGAIFLAAKQQLPLHIIALIPATDNRPGLNAYAPGDIVTMYDGTTVEVLNTDAEGRMILADALAYSKKYDPELVIDAATLTGAAHRAVGAQATCMMGNADDKYFDQLDTAGNATHERLIRFPFYEEYFEEMKSPIADLKNLGGASAGMITAGMFLEHFVEAPYIHLDIAGPAWLDSTNAYRTRGGTGTGVRMLYHFLKNYA
ncbi:MAG: leucyl aminopeptidase [Flavobacteriaceae bacterium]|jgi:leucyl aminopeptidase